MDEIINLIIGQSRASQSKQELAALLRLLMPIPRRVVVEIGVHKGYSLEIWRKALNPKILVGIENHPEMIDFELIEKLGVHIVTFNSKAAFDKVKSITGNIDFLFIDGDHSYEGVKSDFELYSPLVRYGGIIALHDIMIKDPVYHGIVEVNKFWNEVKKNYQCRELTSLDGTGTGVIFV